MNFTLKVLGTASAMPVPNRFPSAQVLNVHGRLFLIDCGEGTQFQLEKYKISLLKIDAIYISHIHGDHVFGIFGLLSTIGMKGRLAPIHIYAPNSFGPILKFFLSYYGEGLAYEIVFHSINPKQIELIFECKAIQVFAFPLNHRMDTFGYMIKEKTPLRNVHKFKIEQYGLNILEIAALKRGEDVVRGAYVIENKEATYLPYAPRAYAYCSDTAYMPILEEWLQGVNVIYHETTYLKDQEDLALKRYHSTTVQAATLAKNAGVGKLLIAHYSSRCKDIKKYEAECREIFPNTFALNDGDVYEI